MSEKRVIPPARPFGGARNDTPTQHRSAGRAGRELRAAGRVARILAGILFLAAPFGTAVTFT